MTKKQAQKLEREEIEDSMRNVIRSNTQLISVRGLVSLKPREQRKGIPVFAGKKTGKGAKRANRRAR